MAASRKPSDTVVELQPETHERLQRISKEEHRPVAEIVTDLVDRYEHQLFWKRANESMDQLRADPVAWEDYKQEMQLSQDDSSVLLDEEPYFTPEEEEEIRAAARAEGR